MKITCPKNKTHHRFSVTAHVSQTWEVDASGFYNRTITDYDDVFKYPESGDLYACLDCGAAAEVE